MMTINANTKIAALLKANPDALEAIISISPKFNKLKNPLLRKLMASRTSISMASKVAGCSVKHFFEATRTADETASKPDPLMLFELMQECNVAAERTLMIGDTTHDLEMARAAGVQSAAVSSGAHPEEQLRSYASIAQVSTVVDLAKLLIN